MARIRTIKPAFFRSHLLWRYERDANKDHQGATYFNIRTAFAGLITAADREGRFKWSAEELKLDCLPYDLVDFEDILTVMAGGDDPFIVRYEVNGIAYGWIPGFKHHQRPHPAEAQSVLPPPPSDIQLKFSRSSDELQLTLGREWEGKGTNGASSHNGHGSQPPSLPPFMSFQCSGNPKSWDLLQPKLAEYKATFKGLNVEAECRKAWQWAQDNPAKRKTARGMPAFLSRWLGKAQDSYGGRGGEKPAQRGVPEGRVLG